MHHLTTPALYLKLWGGEHRHSNAQMLSDPRVRRYFPSCLDAMQAARQQAHLHAVYLAHGYSFLPMHQKSDDVFVGYIGLLPCDYNFGPNRQHGGVEIGWTLAPEFWGRGYATQMGRALAEWARETLGLPDLIAFTVPENQASIAVMKRMGFSAWGQFDHPKLAADSPLLRHVLYRLDLA